MSIGSGTARSSADWERVELDYRAGIKSVREIADEHGISHTAINKRAKAKNWERDLRARIQAKAEALVSKAEVSAEVAAERLETETATVDANAEAIARVRLGHRRDIRRGRDLVMSMLDELESQSSPETRDAFRRLGEIMAAPDEYGRDKLNDAYMAAVSLPERIKGVKALTEALKNLVALEREAWSLDAATKPSDAANPVAAFLAGLTGAGACRLPFADGATRTATE